MNKLKCLSPIFSLTIIWSIYHSGINALKIYPVVMNLMFFLIFLISSFRDETVIQKIVKRLEKNVNEEMMNYAKKLTYIWICVCATNLFFSIITMFLPNEYWVLYNGCLCYILMGSVLLIEYPVRQLYKKRINIE